VPEDRCVPALKGELIMPDKPLDIDPDEVNTYFIYAAERNGIELARLIRQTQLLLDLQGELYPQELDQVTTIRSILDIACGPGAWAIEAARAHPDRQVIGIDISLPMIEHAQMFAEAEGVSNVKFLQMDALSSLAFNEGSFDLINADALYTFLTPGLWLSFLRECKRVLRPGGLMKIGELEYGITNGEATEALYRVWTQTMKRAGRSFSCDGWHHGTTAMLRPLLRAAGYVQIGHKAYALDCSYGEPWHQAFWEDLLVMCRHMQPFIRRVCGEQAVREQQELLTRASAEIKRPDFVGIIYRLSAWGVNPGTFAEGRDD